MSSDARRMMGIRPVVDGYDELRLRIDRREASAYRVFASTRESEASATLTLPFNALEIENFILKVSRRRARHRVALTATADARRFGGALFAALFNGDVLGVYRTAIDTARAKGHGVRITLCLSGAPELVDVPWEYLCDNPDFLAVSAFTPVVRYLDLPRAPRPLLVDPPLRVLGVISNPSDCEALDVERERANLERALTGLTDAGAIELTWLERPTLPALLTALQRETFHALHYIGHGSYDRDAEQGVLLFEDDAGWRHPVSGDRLGTVLHDFSHLRLAVLNACEGARSARTDPFAGVAGALVQRDIPAVVAMQFEISDEAAITFADGFYRPLAAGAPVDTSVSAARLAMLAERGDDIEWGTPVLFMRVPDGRIFDLGDRSEAVLEEARMRVPRPRPPPTRGSSPVVFLNYRREDAAGHALLLADRLRAHFGEANVRLEEDHVAAIGPLEQTPARGAFLTLIGPSWLQDVRRASAMRHADDVARRAVESALRDLPDAVIPVLVDAAMPAAETLPRSLRGLVRCRAVDLRHATFDRDVHELIGRIETVARPLAPPASPDRRPPATIRPPALTRAGGAAIAAGVASPYDAHYLEVVRGLLDGTVVPLLGPGVCGADPSRDPVAAGLGQRFDTGASGLAEVAQRVPGRSPRNRPPGRLAAGLPADHQRQLRHRS